MLSRRLAEQERYFKVSEINGIDSIPLFKINYFLLLEIINLILNLKFNSLKTILFFKDFSFIPSSMFETTVPIS